MTPASYLSPILFFVLLAPFLNRIEAASFIDRQLACALDAGPCDRFGREVKDALPEIIGNDCAACNRNQLVRARRVAEFLRENYPVEWNLLLKKYQNNDNGRRNFGDY